MGPRWRSYSVKRLIGRRDRPGGAQGDGERTFPGPATASSGEALVTVNAGTGAVDRPTPADAPLPWLGLQGGGR
jgi:hypothetical protein